jgi:hypothetical protein
MTAISWLLVVDGAAFVLIGLVVLAAPSPQPALSRPLDGDALQPFVDTRRLLASQFVGVGLLGLLVGSQVHDVATLRMAAVARILTLAVVIAINVAQLRGGDWKPAPLYSLLVAFSLLSAGYLALAVTA